MSGEDQLVEDELLDADGEEVMESEKEEDDDLTGIIVKSKKKNTVATKPAPKKAAKGKK